MNLKYRLFSLFLFLSCAAAWAQPAISVAPGSLLFGNVPVNSDSTRILNISNIGNDTLWIDLLEITGAQANQFSIPNPPSLPFSISPGGPSLSLPVRFTPTFFGNKSANLSIGSNDPAQDTLDVLLSGVGVEPNIITSTDSLNYGSLPVNSSAQMSVNIFNLGGADLVINSLLVSGADSSLFSIVNLPALPLVITPGSPPLLIEVQFLPTTAGAKAALLQIGSNDPDENPRNVILTGTGLSPVISVSPGSLDFGEVAVGLSAVLPLTIENTGNQDLIVSGVDFLGQFGLLYSMVNPPSFPVVISAGGPALSLDIKFSPNTQGIKPSFMVIINNDPNQNPFVLPVTGTGVEADIFVTPASLDFGAVIVDSDTTLTFQIGNSGTGTLAVSSLEIIGFHKDQFSLINPPPLPLMIPAGSNPVQIVVQFSPDTTGLKDNAFVSIISNDPDENPVFVPLKGLAVKPEIVLNPPQLLFGDVEVGQDSVLSFYVKNRGDADLIVSNAALTGVAAAEYSITEIPALPFTIPVGNDSAKISIRFSPASVGSKLAALELVNNDPSNNIMPESLNGTGVEPDISSSLNPLDFGEVLTGFDSTITFQIVNIGGAPLIVNSAVLTGNSSSQFRLISIDTLPATLAPSGGSINVSMGFSPSLVGADSAELHFDSNDPDQNPFVIGLNGLGVQALITTNPDTLNFTTVRVGNDSSLTLQIINRGSAPLIISNAQITGADLASFLIAQMPQLPFVVPAGGGTQSLKLQFSPLSIGLKTAALQLTNSDPNNVSFEVPLVGQGVEPDIAAFPVPMDFGGVIINSDSIGVLKLINAGGADLEVILALIIRADGSVDTRFNFVNPPVYPVLISPQDSVPIMVRFAPDSLKDEDAEIQFFSDDPDEFPFVVPLTGRGVTPEISVNLDTLNFGATKINAVTGISLEIANLGNAPLKVQDLKFGGLNDSLFSIISSPGLPFTIPVNGDSVIIEVGFLPDTSGFFSAALTVFSNDPIRTPPQITIKGRGVFGPNISAPSLSGIRFNQDYPLSVFAASDTTVRSVVLKYAPNDTSGFGFVDTLMSVGGNSYFGIIPAVNITSKGLKILLEAVDNFPITTSDTFLTRVEIPQGALTHSFTQTQLNRWQMFSLPFDSVGDGSIDAVLKDLGPEGDFTWKIYRLDDTGVNTNYFAIEDLRTMGDFGSFAPGNAFWLFLRNDDGGQVPATTISFPTMNTVPGDSVVYSLSPGWNQIGSPFAFDITSDQIISQEKDTLEIYQWNEQGWTGPLTKFGWSPKVNSVFTLAPFEGLAVRNNKADTVKITFLPYKPLAADSGLFKPAPGSDWQIKLVAETRNTYDVNIIGMHPEARTGQDHFDYANPSPVGREYVSISFHHNDWASPKQEYSSDFRPIDDEGQIWYLSINSSQKVIDFSLQEIEGIPADFFMVVYDAKYRQKYDIFNNRPISLRDLAPNETNRFAILVGTDKFIASEIDNIVLLQPQDTQLLFNYPNPFNPETFIRYRLSEPGKVKLVVYNILGQKVVTLLDEFKEAGFYELRWDGRTNEGRKTASGVFFYQLKINGFVQTKKMLKVN